MMGFTKKTISPYLNRNGGTWNMGMKKEHDSAHLGKFFIKKISSDEFEPNL
jgi:hypothetical protein